MAKRYAADTKAKILAAAKGKKLAAAHAAAQKVGYKGSAASLYQMLYAAIRAARQATCD